VFLFPKRSAAKPARVSIKAGKKIACAFYRWISLSAVVSTTLMTLFSYCVGRLRNKQFMEPEILNDLLMRNGTIEKGAVQNHPLGWFIHYLVGFQFIIAYEVFWHTTSSSPTLGLFVVLGAVSGGIGVIAWSMFFLSHSNPPRLDFKEFYLQLVVAHMVFGVGAFLTFIVG
jgi:hypothetical protein